MNSIEVKHSGESGSEYRGRERMEMMRKNGGGFKRRSSLVDFD